MNDNTAIRENPMTEVELYEFLQEQALHVPHKGLTEHDRQDLASNMYMKLMDNPKALGKLNAMSDEQAERHVQAAMFYANITDWNKTTSKGRVTNTLDTDTLDHLVNEIPEPSVEQDDLNGIGLYEHNQTKHRNACLLDCIEVTNPRVAWDALLVIEARGFTGLPSTEHVDACKEALESMRAAGWVVKQKERSSSGLRDAIDVMLKQGVTCSDDIRNALDAKGVPYNAAGVNMIIGGRKRLLGIKQERQGKAGMLAATVRSIIASNPTISNADLMIEVVKNPMLVATKKNSLITTRWNCINKPLTQSVSGYLCTLISDNPAITVNEAERQVVAKGLTFKSKRSLQASFYRARAKVAQ